MWWERAPRGLGVAARDAIMLVKVIENMEGVRSCYCRGRVAKKVAG